MNAQMAGAVVIVSGIMLFVWSPVNLLRRLYPYGHALSKLALRLIAAAWILMGLLFVVLPTLKK